MNFWITTHWPRREDRSIEEPRRGVWVQTAKQHLIDRVSPGDLAFIYETKSGPAVMQKYADGSTKRIGRYPGSEGIVPSFLTWRDLRPIPACSLRYRAVPLWREGCSWPRVPGADPQPQIAHNKPPLPLKLRIADDPAGILGEPGLTLWNSLMAVGPVIRNPSAPRAAAPLPAASRQGPRGNPRTARCLRRRSLFRARACRRCGFRPG